jgi:hypothetical protein
MKRLASTAMWWQPLPHRKHAVSASTTDRKASHGQYRRRLHKCESQLCILTEAGELIEQRIATTRERFTAVLGSRRRSGILLELYCPSGHRCERRSRDALMRSRMAVVRISSVDTDAKAIKPSV